MEKCLFCKIASGELPTRTIYEDNLVIAFLDITPFSSGHTLLIPKEHYRWVWEIPDDLTSHFYKVANKIARHFQKVDQDKLVFSLTSGLLVEHCHLHIIPNSSEKFSKNLSKALKDSRQQLNDSQFEKIHSKYKLPN